MREVAEAIFYTLVIIAILACIMVVIGEPDILDGLIKRASDVSCEVER